MQKLTQIQPFKAAEMQRVPRMYSAGTARWLTAVRLQELLEGEHPYSYAENNPVTLTDPSGDNPDRVGKCKVFVCNQYGWGRLAPITHRYLCVTGPNGGCAGGLYPARGKLNDWEYGVPGLVGDKDKDCKTKPENKSTGQYQVSCWELTNGVPEHLKCEIAQKFCECVQLMRNKPPSYEGLSVCYQFPNTLARCVSERTTGAARNYIDQIRQVL